MRTLNAAQLEAIATADAHLQNVALPTYRELVERLSELSTGLLQVGLTDSMRTYARYCNKLATRATGGE